MGKARLNGGGVALAPVALAAVLACPAMSRAAAPSRFASYDSEAECVAAHTLAPALCRTAFANARAEYESKTPSFPTAALCARRFSACMAWPPDADPRKASFRPRWEGVDIVDTPAEHSVTPSPGSTGRTIRFAARPLDAETPRELVIRGMAPPASRAVPGPSGMAARPSSAAPAVRRAERASAPSAPPQPGSGFKLEDGVLTYPAPARFQPKNLPKLPE